MKKFLSDVILVSGLLLSAFAMAEDNASQPLNDPDHKFDLIPASDSGEQRRIERQKYFLERQTKDRETYTAATLKEIEDLYQVANVSKFSNEAKENLEKLVSDPRYEKSNRVGCALIYLATMPNALKAEEQLKLAIEKHSDCWYGDGVNVGAYARYILANNYIHAGQKEEAEKLISEIKANYNDAIDHAGNILADKLP